MKTAAIILAGGTGRRIGADIPKQLLKTGGRTIIEYTISAFEEHPLIDEICIVSHADWITQTEALVSRAGFRKVKHIITGGKERSDSSQAAIKLYEADDILLSASIISIFIGASVFYFSASFVVFMLYCIFLQVIPKKRDFDYVIIHGAGLLKGDRISKLLSDRLDKAIDVYHKDPTPPILIPSGGKGSDEKLSEAEAMEKYLLEKGIPAEKIIREDKSATTFENLRNSKAIIDSQTGSKYTALVTSNYHVYRALRYCRKIGLKCTGIGSHVALYYWPSALIREFIAVHAEKKHLIYLIVGWILFMLPLFLFYFSSL